MVPFNLLILHEMNHNLRKLSYQISKDRPDLDIKENMINSIYDKTIYVGDQLTKTSYADIVIFNKNSHRNKKTILANSGHITSLEDGIILDLDNGSIHEYISTDNNEYRKTYFDKYKILIPFEEININNKKVLIKQDREMDINTLLLTINNKKNEIVKLSDNNIKNKFKIDELQFEKTNISSELKKIESEVGKENKEYKNKFIRLSQIKTLINNLENSIKKNNKIIPHFKSEVNHYKVELHKKFSIPIACIIFILLGIPLGIVSKEGSFSISIAISLGFFILYWSLLQVGEFLGDEGKINPAISMWLGNIFLGLISMYLFYISSIGDIKLKEKFQSIKNLLINTRT